ncbi:MAG: esterase/lipase family protein [Rhodococcus sp. (in: high G+C Gram-positive bacteria)]|uniref:esterase/lipase family protein n=1 Tax=Rhodococcus sp. I2R TaxID=2855445 RepID=UPI0022A8CD6A|nr:alpha/beta fold hydrolase [uncultured Rhodococcus sp.]MCC8929544.1 alpha/beta fold hydrolase [Rhodococcus sp. I2R]
MSRHTRTLLSIFFSLLVLVGAVATAPTAGAQPAATPRLDSLERMGAPPEGANDWSCSPSEAHPRPVVLVHGTDTDMQESWPVLSPELAAQGYCVFALNYGAMPVMWDHSQLVWGIGDIENSAAELAEFVDAVLASTGAEQVDLVGHSQGGTMARQYLKFNGGSNPTDPSASKVRNLVTLGATNHGTNFNGLQQLYLLATSVGIPRDFTSQLVFGVAGSQQLIGSPMLRKLNAGSEVMPGVDYTVIATRDDQIVTPPERTFLDDRGTGQVTNLWAQDLCPGNTASHMGLTRDPDVSYMISTALDPNYSNTNPLVCAESE